MLKKTITYTDYNGTKRKEDFYFNLSMAEITQMELSTDGGIQNLIEKIVQEQNNRKLVEFFKDFILRSYGEKSDDGKHFNKSREVVEAFTQTEAFSELFMELLTNTDEAVRFITGVIPQSMAEEVEKMRKNGEYENHINSLLPEQ